MRARAVIEYFPDDRIFTPEAKERLAVLYLRSHQLDEAEKLFDDLESMGGKSRTRKSPAPPGKP